MSWRRSVRAALHPYYVECGLTGLDASLQRLRLVSGTRLRERPTSQAPVIRLVESETAADLLGRFRGFRLLRLADRTIGWIEEPRPVT